GVLRGGNLQRGLADLGGRRADLRRRLHAAGLQRACELDDALGLHGDSAAVVEQRAAGVGRAAHSPLYVIPVSRTVPASGSGGMTGPVESLENAAVAGNVANWLRNCAYVGRDDGSTATMFGGSEKFASATGAHPAT